MGSGRLGQKQKPVQPHGEKNQGGNLLLTPVAARGSEDNIGRVVAKGSLLPAIFTDGETADDHADSS
ncbi:MAG: hypothetical protein QGI86_00275 [Candidatus Poribacteria bacterium]|nr:hypothetical protein [Candidatus Poribacteria bacterium]MDP6746147.1 hypothetical protein [Candidatus Poribacteria bacterium]MDP6994586.1 hypothetical protein [Candidatus Poribacteria bacterium]